jgi:hypothetical protein
MPWSVSEGIRSGFNNGTSYQLWQQPNGHEAELAELRETAGGLLQENEAYQQAIAERDHAIAERDRAIAGRDREMGKMMAYIRELETQRGEFYQRWIACAHDLASAVTTRDRYQAAGKRYKALCVEMEALLKFHGVFEAIRKIVHPNAHGGKSPDFIRACTEMFKTFTAVFDRLRGVA